VVRAKPPEWWGALGATARGYRAAINAANSAGIQAIHEWSELAPPDPPELSAERARIAREYRRWFNEVLGGRAYIAWLAAYVAVVVEARSRSYVEQRVRAGVLEHGTVGLLHELGVGARMAREGLVHDGVALRFGGRTKGIIVVGFDRASDCGETQARLVDAAAQQAALAAHVATLYQAARRSSATLAKEVERRTAEAEAQRRFTEAIIDSLPLSLYAIDRDYRIVAWNRNRELGGQGVVIGSVVTFVEISERKRMTAELQQAKEAAEAANDPQVVANSYVTTVEGARRSFPLVASPAQFDDQPTTLRRAPDHGENTEEILLALGRDWDEITRLKETGAVL